MRILVVDDDAPIRKWLSSLLMQIPDREISIMLAENGVEALDKIQDSGAPDLLITDIKMPKMDGLELCQRLKQSFPYIPVVILSSYEEFAYVKKALQLGAMDYILKSDMCLEDVSAIIEKVRVTNQQDKCRTIVDKDYAEKNKHLLEMFMRGDKADESTFLLRLDAKLNRKSLLIMMIRANRNIDALLSGLAEESASMVSVLIPYADLTYIALLSNKWPDRQLSLEEKRQLANDFLTKIRTKNYFVVEAWSTVLNCNETSIYASIQTCQMVLDFKYYYSLDHFEQTAYRKSGADIYAQIPFYKNFFEVASRYQVQEAVELLRKTMNSVHEMYWHPVDIKRYIGSMCHKLLSDMPVVETGGKWFNRTVELLGEVEMANTMEKRVEAVERFIEQYSTVLSMVSPKYSDAVLKAVEYIDGSYTEKITLENVAEHAHVYSTYISELFKKEMGVSLNDYINNLRVILACELLRSSNRSIGQIAEECGFSDQNYFTKVFKKFLNTTPSSYRMQFKN